MLIVSDRYKKIKYAALEARNLRGTPTLFIARRFRKQ